MGNSGSNARERHKSCDLDLLSPHREMQSQAFIFDKDSTAYQEQGIEEFDSCCNKQLSVNSASLYRYLFLQLFCM